MHNPVIIKLSMEEAKRAMEEGEAAVKRVGGDNGYTVNINTVIAHQIGCAAEIAVCKHLGIEWGGHGYFRRHGGDAGDTEVRATQHKRGRLILNKRDQTKSSRKYILVISLGMLQFELKGWAHGYEVMCEGNEFNRDHFKEECWAIGQDKLRPIETLNE